MRNWASLLLGSAAVLVLSICPAWGQIQNGDFSAGLTGWEAVVWPLESPSQALVEVNTAGQLHVRVANSYVYDTELGWSTNDLDTSAVSVTQDFVPNGPAPVGTTGLQFNANVQISNNFEGNPYTMVMVGVNYYEVDPEGPVGERFEAWSTPFSTGGPQTVTINLPNLIVDYPVLDLFLYAMSGVDFSVTPPVPGNYDIVVDGTFDDFQFVGGQLASVLIDIRPGDSTNAINLGSHGGIPVAILGTETFDVLQVDPLSVTLADAGVRVRGKGKSIFSTSDVNGDGLLDMILNIDTQALVLTPDVTQAVLKGMTYDGVSFQGSDHVTIVGQGSTVVSAPALAPEPSTVMLLILGGASVLRRRRSRGN